MTNAEYPTATPESVWAALRETDRLMKEYRVDYERQREKFLADYERQRDEYMANYERQRVNHERQRKESMADYERRMKKLEKTMGSWSNNQGEFAEEYFFNSFENGKCNFFGEKFDRIMKNVKGLDYKMEDEYDILLVNGKSVGIIEVKYKAHVNDLPKVLRKVETFRANHPTYANHRIYLGLATMVFYPDLEQECIKQGIAVVKQVGDTVVINDAHLKAF